jgi:hypothetical protein
VPSLRLETVTVGLLRASAVRFTWAGVDLDALLASIDSALGGEVGEWEDDDGELMGIARLKTGDGLNLASYWKAGFFASVEPIGLSIDRSTTADGSEALAVIAMIPPAGNPLGKARQGLIQIATMPGATWLPFENMGTANLQVDFINPQ